MDNLSMALLLMVVGVSTVFVILLIVIYLGKALIAFVNRFVPEEETPASRRAAGNAPASIPGNIKAAIEAAISVATHGEGKVTKIEKL